MRPLSRDDFGYEKAAAHNAIQDAPPKPPGILSHTRDTMRKDLDRLIGMVIRANDIADRICGSQPEAGANSSKSDLVMQPCLAGDFVEVANGLAMGLSRLSAELDRIEGAL